MKHKTLFNLLPILSLALALTALPTNLSEVVSAQRPEPSGRMSAQATLGTAFTYQGRLTDGGDPANTTFVGDSITPPAGTSPPDVATHDRVKQALFNLPLRFIANDGQTDPAVRFTVKGAGHTLFFTEEGVVFSASIPEWRIANHESRITNRATDPTRLETRNPQPETQTSSVVRLRFLGANPQPTIEGLAPLPGAANFFLGNDPAKWRTNVPTYGAVAYRDLYPEVDLVYRGTEGHLKSEFRLAPGADPAAILMAYSGLETLHLREDGALVLQTPLGELIETAPLVYQEVDGVRQEIKGHYLLLDENGHPIPNTQSPIPNPIVGFQVSDYDPTLPLVIDPELAFSTYLGGSGEDLGYRIAVDGAGDAYVTGWTQSSDFPTHNAIQPSYGGGNSDVFVTQIISASGGYTYGYSTYLGGSSNDAGFGIAVDSVGDTYVTGATGSSDFPTRNAIQPSYGGGDHDAFVAKITSAGGVYTLAYSTYLGGNGRDSGNDIAVDGAGDAYVTGETRSSNFPTRNAIDTTLGGNRDAFVAKITSASGVYTLAYSTYLGGGGRDLAEGFTVDGAGDAYVTGYTESRDFPTRNAIQPGYGGGYRDAFVTQIISAGGVYTYGYSTYLGGGGHDFGCDIVVDGAGDAYVTGQTYSSDFPTHNAIQPSFGGYRDAFVTQITSASGVYTYGYSTYLGGSGDDWGYGIAVDSVGDTYVTGATGSSDFPIRNAIQPGHGGGSYDAFVSHIISASGIYTYGYSTYLGGNGRDSGNDIAVDGAGNAYVTGVTFSSDFPTRNAIDTTLGGDRDAFVAKIAGAAPVAVDDAYDVDEDNTLDVAAPGVLGNDSDADGDPLTAILVGDVGHGALTLNEDGSFTYTPNTNFFGTDTFTYKANDGKLDSNEATVTITVNAVNDLPDCSAGRPSVDTIWPPNHKFVAVEVLDVIDPDGDPITITITDIWQDEPVDTNGDGSFTPDGKGVGTSTAEVRAERAGSKKVPGNGRVYHIFFTADDGHGGSCSGEVLIGVPHDQGKGGTPVDDGALYDSTALSP